jgi:hypothetical protein
LCVGAGAGVRLGVGRVRVGVVMGAGARVSVEGERALQRHAGGERNGTGVAAAARRLLYIVAVHAKGEGRPEHRAAGVPRRRRRAPHLQPPHIMPSTLMSSSTVPAPSSSPPAGGRARPRGSRRAERRGRRARACAP